ncbi:MAG: hypothetical protein AAGN82_02780 [Myxococcota bacterium]
MARPFSVPRRSRRPSAIHVASFAAVLAALPGCTEEPADPAPPPQRELLDAGPNAVGFIETELSYDPVGTPTDRELLVRLWYPAVDGGEAAAAYALAGIVDLPTERALDAPTVARGTHPVAVYSHGNGGDGLVAYPYGEHLASHGWVVAAVNHTGNTALDALGGRASPFARVLVDRPGDVSAVLDWLDGDASPLAGSARVDDALVFGHSFGGYTAFAVAGASADAEPLIEGCANADGADEDCAVYADPEVQASLRAGYRDPRVKAIVPQAPAFITGMRDGALGELSVPTLMISGRRDITTTDATTAIPAWDGLDDPRDLWLEMPDGGHITFITVCTDLDEATLLAFQPSAPQDGCGPEFIDPTVAIPVMNGYLLGFARAHVLGETRWRDVLTGPVWGPGFELTVADGS